MKDRQEISDENVFGLDPVPEELKIAEIKMEEKPIPILVDPNLHSIPPKRPNIF